MLRVICLGRFRLLFSPDISFIVPVTSSHHPLRSLDLQSLNISGLLIVEEECIELITEEEREQDLLAVVASRLLSICPILDSLLSPGQTIGVVLNDVGRKTFQKVSQTGYEGFVSSISEEMRRRGQRGMKIKRR